MLDVEGGGFGLTISTISCLHLTADGTHKLLPPPDGVRVSGGHLCEAEAPTEAAAETVGFDRRSKLGGRDNADCRKTANIRC